MVRNNRLLHRFIALYNPEDNVLDFIFMLTRYDQTVTDCVAVFESIRSVGLTHVGFKDVGVDLATLKILNGMIQDAGATSYMEVVSTSKESALQSARAAVTIGVDRLMGGIHVDEVLAIVADTGIEYFPFPGTPVGHPTDLHGDEQQIENHCREFAAKGCPGVDLLAYRAVQADPLELTRAARTGLGSTGRLICAGSINSARRIRELAAAGCDAFTIGSAAFDGSFSPAKGLLQHQLEDILRAAD
jgi:hypothetical protein